MARDLKEYWGDPPISSCQYTQKIVYPTRKEAERAAMRIKATSRAAVKDSRPYVCRCEQYHLTRRK